MLTIIISWMDSTWENELKAHIEYLDFAAPSVYFKFHIQVPLWLDLEHYFKNSPQKMNFIKGSKLGKVCVEWKI